MKIWSEIKHLFFKHKLVIQNMEKQEVSGHTTDEPVSTNVYLQNI